MAAIPRLPLNSIGQLSKPKTLRADDSIHGVRCVAPSGKPWRSGDELGASRMKPGREETAQMERTELGGWLQRLRSKQGSLTLINQRVETTNAQYLVFSAHKAQADSFSRAALRNCSSQRRTFTAAS